MARNTNIQWINEIAMATPTAKQVGDRWVPVPFPGADDAPITCKTREEAVARAKRMNEAALISAIAYAPELEWKDDRKRYAGMTVERYLAHPDAPVYSYRHVVTD